MISIAIADSHTICREALCDFLRHADQSLVIEGFSDYQSLREHIKIGRPDIVLVDFNLFGLTDDVIAKDFESGEAPMLGMIVPQVSTSNNVNYPLSGVFPRTLSSKDFLSGIQDMLSGKKFFPNDEEIRTEGERIFFKRTPQDFNLTAREKEVLGYLVKGASNKDIARSLDLQVVTVKLHVRGICRKTKASNRTQAALIAVENGWT